VLAIALGAAMLVALAASFALRRRRAAVPLAPITMPSTKSVDGLARAIAELDSEFERRESLSEVERAAYRARRDELKQHLARALDESRPRA
jgi:hypothetical protein